MKDADDKLFQAREFAELTGVTVRTLHHYDRLGLLKPSRYSRAGYRLYRASDVARLEYRGVEVHRLFSERNQEHSEPEFNRFGDGALPTAGSAYRKSQAFGICNPS